MNFEEQNQTPSTPLRGLKASTSEHNGGAYTGNKFSPMPWPSPGPSFGGITSPRSFGIQRTPMHGFGTAAIAEGRLSMGLFEFGADGELVLYSAGGRAIPPSVDRSARSPGGPVRAGTIDASEIPRNKLRSLNADLSAIDEKEEAKKRPGDAEGGRQLPVDQLDGLTPLSLVGCVGNGQGNQSMTRLSTGGVVCGTGTMKQSAARQLSMSTVHGVHGHADRSGTLTDGGRCRYKTVAFNSGLDTLGNPVAAVRTPLSPLELSLEATAAHDQPANKTRMQAAEEDMSNATPEMRTRKIKSLYAELQSKQGILGYLQGRICLADQQIAKLIRTNVGLWACSAHIASCIGMALEEESRAEEALKNRVDASSAEREGSKRDPLEDVENLATTNNTRQSKRRRSSLGVASLTQSLHPKSNKVSRTSASGKSKSAMQALVPSNTSTIAQIDGKQLMELEEIFAKPQNCEFATGEMMNHLPLSSNVLKKTGMCPVKNHDTMDARLSPAELQDDDYLATDVENDPKEDIVGARETSLPLCQENSFSFHC